MGKYSETEITKALQKLEAKHGLSRADLADAMQATRSRISTFINGHRQPNEKELQKLSTWLVNNHPAIELNFMEMYTRIPPRQVTSSQHNIEDLASLPFGKQFQAIRESANITRGALGEELGLSAHTVTDWEQGRASKAGSSPATPQPDKLSAAINIFKEKNSSLLTPETEAQMRAAYRTIRAGHRTSLGAVSRNISLGKPPPDKGRS